MILLHCKIERRLNEITLEETKLHIKDYIIPNEIYTHRSVFIDFQDKKNLINPLIQRISWCRHIFIDTCYLKIECFNLSIFFQISIQL